MSELLPESHPLLNCQEFENAFHALDYDRVFGRTAFNRIVRGGGGITPERTSESIYYYEENPSGAHELVVSLPNIALHLAEIATIRQVGTGVMEAVTKLVKPYQESQ